MNFNLVPPLRHSAPRKQRNRRSVRERKKKKVFARKNTRIYKWIQIVTSIFRTDFHHLCRMTRPNCSARDEVVKEKFLALLQRGIRCVNEKRYLGQFYVKRKKYRLIPHEWEQYHFNTNTLSHAVFFFLFYHKTIVPNARLFFPSHIVHYNRRNAVSLLSWKSCIIKQDREEMQLHLELEKQMVKVFN